MKEICGRFFGREILLLGMVPGTGIRACCVLLKNHEGWHALVNPDLKGLEYEQGDLG